MASLIDRYGRRFPYLRLSVIEACNFRCSYCLPKGYQARPDLPRHLGVDEIHRLLTGFARLGMRKVRLTGGEPSLRRDLTDIIGVAAAVPGVEKIALTTNGVLLPQRIDDWRAAGLSHLNVSVDALDRARFAEITGHDRLPHILDGIDRALALGLSAVKLNAVLLRGLNDDQLPAFLDYLRDRPISLRFIELMQTGDNLEYFRRHHYRAEALEDALQTEGWSLLPRAADAGPAREYAHPDYRGRIGIIAPYSRDFCAGCNRLRVTSSGDLRLCLFGNVGIPLRPLLQDDDQADELQAALISQLGLKALGHGLHEGQTGLTPHLASIGG
ncbi:GTP 3',8-cyclase MoaA [uncultured Aquimonas sp.]|jgi:GTP 3',8-cyclase|uniref:GTP 3',8-cyclase MoaA n=1 Tax=uncultured Aquimonas sp. TaxID=385483 RepID=UPI00086CABE9|nr:GTP 3',8-cyclase MoaA [uncultured Aquimonas sp.]ODU44458.1 MAG: cyclic pyranopterin phosphate synthase [Xanthomonadaceae bacterium SCN 69-123]